MPKFRKKPVVFEAAQFHSSTEPTAVRSEDVLRAVKERLRRARPYLGHEADIALPEPTQEIDRALEGEL